MLPLDSSAFELKDGAPGAFRPLGHIALDCVDADGDSELASLELGNVCLATFFVLKELQGRGLGGCVSPVPTSTTNQSYLEQ